MAVNLIDQFGRAARARDPRVVVRAVPGRPRGRRARPPGARAGGVARRLREGDDVRPRRLHRVLRRSAASSATSRSSTARTRTPRARRATRGSADREPAQADAAASVSSLPRPRGSRALGGAVLAAQAHGRQDAPADRDAHRHGRAHLRPRRRRARRARLRARSPTTARPSLTPAGRTMRRIYGERDLLVAESLRPGLWKDLDAASLAALACCLVYEPRRDEAGPGERGCRAGRSARPCSDDAGPLAAPRRPRAATTTCPAPSRSRPASRRRCTRGRAACRSTACSIEADMAAGDFVRWAKQTIDLLDQLSIVADAPLATTARKALDAVRRGIVAYSLGLTAAAPAAGALGWTAVPLAAAPRPILPLWAAVLASVAGGAAAHDRLPGAGWWPMAFVGVALALVELVGRAVWVVAAGRASSFGAAFFFVNLVVHRALPRARAVDRPVDARGAAHGGRRRADHAGVPLDAARAARRAWARLVAAAAARGRAVDRCASSSSGSGRTAASRGAASASAQVRTARSPTSRRGSGVAGLTFLMVRSVRRRRSSTCAPRASARRPHRAADRDRGARCSCSSRSSRRRRPARCASARVQGNGPAGYFDERTRERRAPTPSWRRPLRCSARTSTCCCGRRAESTPIRRRTSRPRRSSTPSSDADRRAADRQRRDHSAATSTSTRRCCGRPARAPCRLYDKRHPVPFGEYVPDRCVLRAVRARPDRPHPARVHAGHVTRRSSTWTASASGSRSAST